MLDFESTSVAIIALAFLIFTFVYWRDAISEGFSSDRIFDSVILILIGGFLGGKLLFRNLGIDYFRYQFLTSPFISEGILVGGAIAVFIAIKRNHWDGWKIGDMLAPALGLFQAFLFFGFWVRSRDLSNLGLFIGFVALSILMRYLRINHKLGSSLKYFEFKRLKRLVFTGGLLATYLTGSSLIAMLFLLTHQNLSSLFWWFQFVFYFLILVSSMFLIRRRLVNEGIKVNPVKEIGTSFIETVKNRLKMRAKEIDSGVSAIDKNDPFIVESEDGFRNEDELGDEVQDNQLHGIGEAAKSELKEEKVQINKTLSKIEEGRYGYCTKCGNSIDKKRLKVYPTAQHCISCEKKIAKGA